MHFERNMAPSVIPLLSYPSRRAYFKHMVSYFGLLRTSSELRTKHLVLRRKGSLARRVTESTGYFSLNPLIKEPHLLNLRSGGGYQLPWSWWGSGGRADNKTLSFQNCESQQNAENKSYKNRPNAIEVTDVTFVLQITNGITGGQNISELLKAAHYLYIR